MRERLQRWFRILTGPRMLNGWRRGDGIWQAHTRISNHCVIFAPDKLDVGDHVFIGHFSVIDATYGLRIGEGCQIGFFTGIFTHSSHVAIRLYGREYVNIAEKQAYFTASVDIGAYTFIGAHATVLPGTRIGKGSIVSSYAQVGGEFPDYAILSGNPAKVVGDTRRMDGPHLKRHPELQAHYDAWAKDGAQPPAAP